MKKHLLTLFALTLLAGANAQTTHFSLLGPPDTEGLLLYSNMGCVQRSDGSFISVEKNAANGFYIRNFSATGTLISTSKIASTACAPYSISSVKAMGANNLLVTGTGNTPVGYSYFVAKINLLTNTATVTTKPVMSAPYTAGPKASAVGNSIYAVYPEYSKFDINKYDANLNPVWTRTCEIDTTTGKNPAMDCEVTDSTIVVVGKCDSYLGTGCIDSSGLFKSFRVYYSGYNRFYSITKTADNNFLVAGLHADVYASTTSSPLIAKISANGDVLWVKILDIATPAMTFARFVDAQELPDGRIVGFATSFEAYTDTYADGVCMLSSTGNFLWAKKFSDGNAITRIYDMKVCPNGVLMSGIYTPYSTGYNSLAMIFTDFDFNQVCNRTSVTLTSDTYYLGTMSSLTPGQAHYMTGTASTTSPMGSLSAAGPETFTVCATTLGQDEVETGDMNVYPNPVSLGGTVYIDMENAADYEFVITDLSGKLLNRQSVNGNRAAVSTQGLATGAYVLSVLHNQQTISVQKLLVK